METALYQPRTCLHPPRNSPAPIRARILGPVNCEDSNPSFRVELRTLMYPMPRTLNIPLLSIGIGDYNSAFTYTFYINLHIHTCFLFTFTFVFAFTFTLVCAYIIYLHMRTHIHIYVYILFVTYQMCMYVYKRICT